MRLPLKLSSVTRDDNHKLNLTHTSTTYKYEQLDVHDNGLHSNVHVNSRRPTSQNIRA